MLLRTAACSSRRSRAARQRLVSPTDEHRSEPLKICCYGTIGEQGGNLFARFDRSREIPASNLPAELITKFFFPCVFQFPELLAQRRQRALLDEVDQ